MGDDARVLAVLAHAHGERLDTAEDEPAVERAGNGAERFLQEVKALRNRRIIRRREAAYDVGMAAEVLRRRVKDDVGPKLERSLQVWRGERVVDDNDCAGGVRRFGGGADVDHVQQRIRRRLQPDDARSVVKRIGERLVDVGGRKPRELVALRLVDLREHPVDAPVDVVDGDDALAR